MPETPPVQPSFIKALHYTGYLLRILVTGERCNVTGEYSERGSTSE